MEQEKVVIAHLSLRGLPLSRLSSIIIHGVTFTWFFFRKKNRNHLIFPSYWVFEFTSFSACTKWFVTYTTKWKREIEVKKKQHTQCVILLVNSLFFPLHPVFNMDFNFFELKSVVTVHVYILFMFSDDTDWLDRSLHVRFIRQFLRFYLIITFFSVFCLSSSYEKCFFTVPQPHIHAFKLNEMSSICAVSKQFSILFDKRGHLIYGKNEENRRGK